MVPQTDDGRVLFVIPWHGRVLVGTTDTPMPRAEIEPRAAARGDRVHAAQRRPLPRPGPGPRRTCSRCSRASARSCAPRRRRQPRELSREHAVLVSTSGLVTIVGGKWTTYRKMAQDALDRRDRGRRAAGAAVRHRDAAPARLDRPRRPGRPPIRTARLRLGPRRRRCARGESPASRAAAPAPALPGAQIVWAARHEMARTLEDVARAPHPRPAARRARRDRRGAARRRCSRAELGRDAAWADAQVNAYRRLAAGYRIAPA